MKRFLRGMWTLTLCFSIVSAITGCQEQESAKVTPSAEVSSPTKPVATESKAVDPVPAKSEVQPQPVPQTEEKKAAPVEKAIEAKPEPETETKAEPAAKPTPAPAPTAKPVQAPASTTVAKPSAPVKSAPAPQPPKQQIVTLSISGDEQVGTILSATKVEWEEGDTVLDVLKKATKEKKIPMEYRGTGAVSYVEGIDNLYEFDRGPKSGWMYRVNGVFGKKSAGDVILKPNDRIEWLYTLELGKDLE